MPLERTKKKIAPWYPGRLKITSETTYIMPLTLKTTDVIPDIVPVPPCEITCKGEFVLVPVVLACELLHSLPGLPFGLSISQTHKSHDGTHGDKRETLPERDAIRPPGVHVCRFKEHDFLRWGRAEPFSAWLQYSTWGHPKSRRNFSPWILHN